MAKENSKIRADDSNGESLPVYFKSLTIENVKCFKGEQIIDLSDGRGKPAQWTVILGNNNTGKTTLLKCIAALEPKEITLTINSNSLNPDEIQEEQVPYVNQKMAGPAFLFTELGDDFLSPSRGNSEFSISSKILTKKDIDTSMLHNSSYEEFSYAGKGEWGKKYNSGHIKLFFGPMPQLRQMIIYSYGASRKMSSQPFENSYNDKRHTSLFENSEISNIEDWLLNLFLAQQLKQRQAEQILDLAKRVLISGILPDVQEVRLRSEEKGSGFENFVEFCTDFGWIRLRDLGYGYQTMITWVLDLVKRMVERYPDSRNPLDEPAIVLVDEIDLHLHPDWQRRIISHLTKYFPNTQFIVTAHSPLIVQSAEDINLVILKKEGEAVHIEQPKIRNFRGWTVEEILTHLMDLDGQTMSQTYLDLVQQFDEALDEDDYHKAKDAYNQLDKILHPLSSHRKLMKIQMTSLSPADAV